MAQEQIIDTFIYVLIMCTLRSRVFLILSILKLEQYTILCGKRTAASCNEFQEHHFLLFFSSLNNRLLFFMLEITED